MHRAVRCAMGCGQGCWFSWRTVAAVNGQVPPHVVPARQRPQGDSTHPGQLRRRHEAPGAPQVVTRTRRAEHRPRGRAVLGVRRCDSSWMLRMPPVTCTLCSAQEAAVVAMEWLGCEVCHGSVVGGQGCAGGIAVPNSGI